MLIDEIKKRVVSAMKAKRDLERDILRLARSEIQAEANRQSGTISEERAHKIIRKLIKSNQESLDVVKDGTARSKLEEEISVLESLLPAQWGEAEIQGALQAVSDAIQSANSDGQATGVAMGVLKKQGAPVDGQLVAKVVKAMRSS